MATKSLFFFLAVAVAVSYGGVVPVAPAAYVANYATVYNAHAVNHAIAAPVAAPLVAAHAPLVAAHAPLGYAAPYASYPYASYPYAAGAYSAPLVVGK